MKTVNHQQDKPIVESAATQTLVDALELLTPPGRWMQGLEAADADGTVTETKDCTAVAWCVAGAVAKCARDFYGESKAYELLRATTLSHRSLTTYNDAEGRTHTEILAWLNRAISLCRERDAEASR